MSSLPKQIPQITPHTHTHLTPIHTHTRTHAHIMSSQLKHIAQITPFPVHQSRILPHSLHSACVRLPNKRCVSCAVSS